MSGGFSLSQKLVVPVIGRDRLTVRFRMYLGKMPSKIRDPSLFPVGIWFEFVLGGLSILAVCLLGDGVAIGEAVPTCISCRLSEAFHSPSWRLEIRLHRKRI